VAASDNGGDTTENTHKPAPAPATAAAAPRPDPTVVGAGRARKLSDFDKARASGPRGAAPVESEWGSVGRNDPCPCGSGRKYKKCHGA
jgi:preprotein translocase subunit SecA